MLFLNDGGALIELVRALPAPLELLLLLLELFTLKIEILQPGSQKALTILYFALIILHKLPMLYEAMLKLSVMTIAAAVALVAHQTVKLRITITIIYEH